jgi:CHAD domain-containing protein
MHPADDVVAAMAADVRSAVAAASGRLQFTVRRIERGNVDLGRLIEDLHDLDLHVRRVRDLVAAVEATAARPGDA